MYHARWLAAGETWPWNSARDAWTRTRTRSVMYVRAMAHGIFLGKHARFYNSIRMITQYFRNYGVVIRIAKPHLAA
jgi:hypothetical protein